MALSDTLLRRQADASIEAVSAEHMLRSKVEMIRCLSVSTTRPSPEVMDMARREAHAALDAQLDAVEVYGRSFVEHIRGSYLNR